MSNRNWRYENRSTEDSNSAINQQISTGTKKQRHRQDLNLRGRSPVDFESTSLTTRTRCHDNIAVKSLLFSNTFICFAAKIASGGAVNTKTFCVRALRPSPPPLAFTDAVTNITFHDIFCLKRDKPPQHCASSQCEHRRQQWAASDLSHHDYHPFCLLPATDATRVYRWMASPPGNAGFPRAPTFSKANVRI